MSRAILYYEDKAHMAFFALVAIYLFQGSCNPLTALSLFNTFIMPIHTYGCVSQFLTETLIARLERFQAEIGKHILKPTRFHNNISVQVGLKWPRFVMIFLYRKLYNLY